MDRCPGDGEDDQPGSGGEAYRRGEPNRGGCREPPARRGAAPRVRTAPMKPIPDTTWAAVQGWVQLDGARAHDVGEPELAHEHEQGRPYADERVRAKLALSVLLPGWR